jgi:hypothetical protein
MSTFQEFPKKMHHPSHVPAVWKQLAGKGQGLFAPDTVCTQVERFPEVTVCDINQEKMYASRGYRPNNMPDPVGYEQAILDTQPGSNCTLTEFPKWKYHAMQIPLIVQNADEERALGAGWADAPIIATEDDLIEAQPESTALVFDEEAFMAATTPIKPQAKAKPKAKRGRPHKTASKASTAATEAATA